MRGTTTQIQTLQGCAITTGSWERTIVANLVVGERADQQIALGHIRKPVNRVRRTERKSIKDHVITEVRCEAPPELEQLFAVSVTPCFPVGRVTAQVVGDFLPQKRRVLARPGLAAIELRVARSPGHGLRDPASLVSIDDVLKLLETLQT